jgi:hypothetical protein
VLSARHRGPHERRFELPDARRQRPNLADERREQPAELSLATGTAAGKARPAFIASSIGP